MKGKDNIDKLKKYKHLTTKKFREVQGVPQLQAAANPWHQEEEKKDKMPPKPTAFSTIGLN